MTPKQDKQVQLAGRIKSLFFWALLLLPLSVILLAAVEMAIRIVEINMLDTDRIIADFKEKMDSKQGEPFNIVHRKGEPGYSAGPYQFMPLVFEPGEKTIYVFGGSSLILPYFEKSFTSYLEWSMSESHHLPVRAFNFGILGYDSYSIKNRVLGAIGFHEPDLVVIYSGHNDFTNNFRNHLAKNLFVIQNSVVLNKMVFLYYRAIYKPMYGKSEGNQELDYFAFLNQSIEPSLMSFFLKIGLVDHPVRLLSEGYDIVIEGYRRNIQRIINETGKKNIPVVLITPIGNLEAKPHGFDDQAAEFHRRGMAETDYASRIGFLKKARDADAFSIDIRAKSTMLDLLRNWRAPNLYILDLENLLIEYGYSFGNDVFLDYVHFSVDSHRLYAAFLLWFLHENNVCCALADMEVEKPVRQTERRSRRVE